MSGKPIANGTLANLTVGVEEIACLYDCTRETIAIWVKHGMPKVGRGRYPVIEVVKWVRQRDSGEVAENDSTLVAERRRLVISQRQRCDLENAKSRSEMLDAELTASAIHACMADIATGMDSLGPRVASRVASIDDPAIVQRMIFDECRNIRRTAAGRLKAFADSFRGLDDPGRPAKPKRRRVGRSASNPPAGEPGAGALAY